MKQKDYYDILGLKKDATQNQVRDAYRRMALLYHPDKNRDNPAATDLMKEINESYAVLSDPLKRRKYDALRHVHGSSAYGRFRQTHTEQDIFRGSDINQIFEDLSRASGFRGFDDIFRESYGAGYRTFEFKRQGAFGRVSFRCVVSGFGRGGQGSGRNAKPVGYLERLIRFGLKNNRGDERPERGKDLQDSIELSSDLARLGGRIRYSCRDTGRELFITIPPNMRAGQKLHLKGMGAAGHAGGEAGDLYVTVHINHL
jgi:DnaJ-class molecular chaperone